jgi:stage V sporulation protein SpoVS
MNLCVDEDSCADALIGQLRHAGHDVLTAAEAGAIGDSDVAQLTRAIGLSRVFLSKNHDDFRDLHLLLAAAGGRHPGILMVRQDNDPYRDMTPKGIANAIAKLVASGYEVANEFVILNHWR